MKKKVQDPVVLNLKKLIDLRKNRNKLYNDLHERKGAALIALFGHIPQPQNESDLNRLGVLNVMINKLLRYCENFDNGGHEDSLDDLSVYSQMLQELDRKLK